MNVLGIIFANDGEIGDLTNKRTTATVPFGGRYRQVDFHLANLSAAGVRHIGIISRRNYQSLMHHVASGEEWGLEMGQGGLEFLTPFSMSAVDNYHGKLETLYTAMDFLEYGSSDGYVIMTGSAILSNVDMKAVLNAHIASGKDLTMVTKAGVANGNKRLDLAVKLDQDGQIEDMVVDYAAPAGYAASMDIFVVGKNWLIQRVKECVAHNLYHMDRDLVLGQWQKKAVSVNVYQFEGHALYNETVNEYFTNSMALISKRVRHDLFGANHPVYTKVRDQVPSYYGEGCKVENSILADGCVLEGQVSHSVLFRQVTVEAGALVSDCVIMNNALVGANCELRYVILDKDVTVRPNSRLIGTPTNPIIIKRGEIV